VTVPYAVRKITAVDRRHLAHALHDLQAVSVRHAHIRNDQRARHAPKFCEGFRRAAGGRHIQPSRRKLASSAARIPASSSTTKTALVLNSNSGCRQCHVNVLPSRGALCTRIVPSCCSITFLQTEARARDFPRVS